MCLQILLMPSFMVHQYYISRKRDVKSDICIRIKKNLNLNFSLWCGKTGKYL